MSGKNSQKWTSATPWRQGHFLPENAISELQSIHNIPKEENICAVIISHDCDIVSQNLVDEPRVEIIIGRIPNKSDGNYSWAKSPRTLHLDAYCQNGPTTIELKSNHKHYVDKEWLIKYAPNYNWLLADGSLNTLRSWLSAKYNRAAYPDDFNITFESKGLTNGIRKILKPSHSLFTGVYVNLSGGHNPSGEKVYKLGIILAYSPGNEPIESDTAAKEVAKKICALFERTCFDNKSEAWNGIELIDCISQSEDALTLGELKKLSELRLDDLSLRDQ